MSVLIAGCGDLGTEAGLRFVSAGHQVFGIRRSPEKLPPQIRPIRADLSREVPELPANAEIVVIALAAEAPTEEAYRAAYVVGLRNVLDAVDRQTVPPKRILFVSSTAVYPDAAGAVVDESTPTMPTRFSGRILLEAEELLLARAGQATATILRLGGIYGPGRTRLIDQLRAGKAVIPGQPKHTNRIHRDDAAAMIVHLATMNERPASVYLGVDDDSSEYGDVLRFLAAALRLPEPPVGPTSDGGAGDKRCSNRRLRSTGFELSYPSYKEGYRAILAGEGVRHA
ncbi:SDR family oxidoreductase [Paenarthrobacter sp. C1]|uniref:SDR family oxidoreductase n=1 Tax=Paenarthrobacter sp. C1 TaxID=3400220 RepID=UPI003BF4A027